MDDSARAWLEGHQDIITTAEAAGIGLSRDHLRRLVAGGHLVRVTRGAYVTGAAFSAAQVTQRHRMRLLAVLRTQPGLWAASHTSAGVVWGLPLSRTALEQVHVARRRRGVTRRHRDYTIHGCYDADAITSHDGVPVVHAALAVIGTAMLQGFVDGVMTADAALHRRLTTREELTHWLARQRHVPGVMRARAAIAAADHRCESPGETRLRLVLTWLGLEVVPQHAVRDGTGQLMGRVDFLLPALGVVVEFDGAVKYGGPADQGTRALVAEKHREDAIRALGYAVVRVTWADLDYPARIEARIREAARISRRAG